MGTRQTIQHTTISVISSNKIALRLITGAPWLIINPSLHNNLQIHTVNVVAKIYYKIFQNKLSNQYNPLIKNMNAYNYA